jgi:hypothetical protein
MATCRRTKSNWMLRGLGIREEDLRPSVLYILLIALQPSPGTPSQRIFYKKKDHRIVVLTAGGGLCHGVVMIDIEVRLR